MPVRPAPTLSKDILISCDIEYLRQAKVKGQTFFRGGGQSLYYILIILINIHFTYFDCWSLCMESSSSCSSYFCLTFILDGVAPTLALRKGILCLPLYKENPPTLPHVCCHYGPIS